MSTLNIEPVDCPPYGTFDLRYSGPVEQSNLKGSMIRLVGVEWPNIWPALMQTTSELAAEAADSIPDFNARFSTHKFEIHFVDLEKWGKKDGFRLSVLFFDAVQNEIYPMFDSTFDKMEIVHAQFNF